ncbi:hypothetical protein GGI20_004162 [Coemansia sp. BCRC 34301]|nr:hypothetical protein GGI20_004162 [Coemansia sp. BCRC 34301]
MEASDPVVTSADPYVDEATRRSLTLCRAIISRPTTDIGTRISCLAKCISLLDALPKVRAFDAQATREYKGKQKVPSASAAASAIENKSESDNTCVWPLELMQILLDRAVTLKDLAAAYRQSGDAQSSTYNLDRAVTLLETFVRFSLSDGVQPQPMEDMRAIATSTLSQVLDSWADVEQSLGRNAKAAKIRTRADKWRFS